MRCPSEEFVCRTRISTASPALIGSTRAHRRAAAAASARRRAAEASSAAQSYATISREYPRRGFSPWVRNQQEHAEVINLAPTGFCVTRHDWKSPMLCDPTHRSPDVSSFLEMGGAQVASEPGSRATEPEPHAPRQRGNEATTPRPFLRFLANRSLTRASWPRAEIYHIRRIAGARPVARQPVARTVERSTGMSIGRCVAGHRSRSALAATARHQALAASRGGRTRGTDTGVVAYSSPFLVRCVRCALRHACLPPAAPLQRVVV
jgi:hypothetical protein